MAAKCPYCGYPETSLSRCSECRLGTSQFEAIAHRIEIGDHTVIDGTDPTQTRILGDTLEEHEVNLRQLWRDLAAKGITQAEGVDYPRIVTTLFGDIDRLQARITTAGNLLDSWEHDAPDLVPDIWYNRIRTALGLKKNG